MKIVCDACQAKYSISDDKVQGKVFKIRCKKCSNIIVVRGGANAAEPAPQPQQEKDTRVYDYGYEGGERAPAGDEAVWHVVINQDQVGPMTAVEVQQRFAGGEIDAETYIWREGFADWLPLAQVDTFAGLASAPASAPAPRGGGSEAVASMFAAGEDAGGARNDPGDLFAAASASSARHDDDGGDLFGGKPVAAPAAAAGAKLRGERNENSVLFSLNNLAQLASDKPAPAPRAAMASGAPVGAATGAAGGEGSGLIDIRSMANAYLGAPGGAPKPASAGIGSIDDLPVFGGGGFTEPAVIVPIAARSNNNKLLYALIGSVGLLAVAAVIVVIMMVKGGGDKAGTQVAQAGKPETAAAEPPKTEAAKAPATPEPATDVKAAGSGATESKAAGSVDNKVATAEAPPEPKHPAPVPTPTPSPHKVATAAGSTPAAPKAPAKSPEKASAPPAPSREPAAAPKGDSGGCDEVSCVLSSYEGACCAKFKKGGGSKSATPSGGGTAPKSGGGDVPDSLDRAMIADGVAKVKPRVTGCSGKSPAKGIVKVSVRVGPDGHVTGVTVKETPDGALGDCVAGIMQKATFAKTQNGGSFAYPFPF
jgi:predicted Zn finger-like uncharacterized protein